MVMSDFLDRRTSRIPLWIGFVLSSLVAEDNQVQTKDGLALKLTPDGYIERVTVGDLAPRLNSFDGGLHVTDAHNPDVPFGIEVSQVSVTPPAFEANIAELFLKATSRYTAAPGYIAIDIDVEDLANQPRALDVSYSVPVGKEGWVWWEGLRQAHKVQLRGQYHVFRAPSSAGSSGQQSLYPFCALSGADGAGLSLAVPPSHPRCFELRYEDGQMVAVFHLGTSPDAGPLKSKASARVLLYRHDPEWGLRDAARLYSQYCPEFFQRRPVRPGAGLFYLTPAALDQSAAADAPGDRPSSLYRVYASPMLPGEEGAAEAESGLEPYLSVSALARLRYFSIYPETPGHAESLLKQLGDPVIQAEIQPYWGPRSDLAKIFKNCLVRTPSRWPAMSRFQADLQNKNAVAQRELNFILNLAPELFVDKKEESSFTAGQRILSSVQRAFETNPRLAGVCLNDLAEAASALNFNREHFPYVKSPLVCDKEHLRPALANRFSMAELLVDLRRRFRTGGGASQGKQLWLHDDCLGQASLLPLLLLADLISFEIPERPDDPAEHASYDWLRTIASSKPLYAIAGERFTRNLASGQDGGEWLSSALRRHTFYGVPLSLEKLWVNKQIAPVLKAKIQKVRQQVALASELQSAGWNPVPHARSDNAQVRIERFGDAGKDLYFTLLNTGREEERAVITITREPLKLSTGGEVKLLDMTRQTELKAMSSENALRLEISISPSDCLVLKAEP
jgi:hypothetical protein